MHEKPHRTEEKHAALTRQTAAPQARVTTTTIHTHKHRKQTAHSERRWLARHTMAEYSREDTIDLDRASQIEVERPNDTREQNMNSTEGSGRKTRTYIAADRPPDAKKFGDTKPCEFRTPSSARARQQNPYTHAHTHTDLSRRRRRRRRCRCRAPRSYSYLERRTGEREWSLIAARIATRIVVIGGAQSAAQAARSQAARRLATRRRLADPRSRWHLQPPGRRHVGPPPSSTDSLPTFATSHLTAVQHLSRRTTAIGTAIGASIIMFDRKMIS